VLESLSLLILFMGLRVQIIVCIKQVPSLEQMKFDPVTKRLVREGVPNNINTFDRRAITEAIKLKGQRGDEVVAVTMGPPQAADALREALMMGCDRAVHLLGREFAGADTLATARVLAAACRKLGFNLILCGKTATDAETAQVPPMLAELLDLPQIVAVNSLTISDDGRSLIAVRETDDGNETLASTLPAVISAGERLNRPIRVGPADAPNAEGKPIVVWGAAELGLEPARVGASGSPTWVETIYSIEPTRKHIMLDGADLTAIAGQLVARLREEGWGANEWKSKPHTHVRARDRKSPGPGSRAIWVVAETVGEVSTEPHVHTGQKLRDVTLELMGAGIGLANQVEGELAAIVMGYKPHEQINTLAAFGADKVYAADAPALRTYATEPYAKILCAAIQQYRPYAVLMGSTANGRDLAPRIAARLGLGLTGDAIGLEIDAEKRLVMLKPAFGGNIVAPILSRTTPALATIRPGMFSRPEPDQSRTTILMRLASYDLGSRTRVIKSETTTQEGIALDEAEIVIGVGAGIGGPENLPPIRAFAERINGHIAGTRKVVDAGWLPPQTQVGLTGRSITPRLYIALGIGGQFNHNVGIQRAGVIVAVNSNPDAAIFKQADYGVVADWRAFVDAMQTALR
jgi:electron transfer flavoprotein alpha subunit